MKSLWQKFTSAVPMPFAAALLVAAGFWAFIAWDQSHWWGTKEDYSFGWLVPLFVAFVVSERWEKIKGYFGGLSLDHLTGWKREKAEAEMVVGLPRLASWGNAPGWLEGLAVAGVVAGRRRRSVRKRRLTTKSHFS